MRPNGLHPVALLAVCAGAVGFAFFGISSRFIWLDEAYAVLTAQLPLKEFFQAIQFDGNPPGYYLLLKSWTTIFGITEAAVRVPSGLFYLGSTFLLGLLGLELYRSKRVGAMASVLFLVSQTAIRHAQSARAYSMLCFFVILSAYLFARIQRGGAARGLARSLWILVNALGLWVHYWFGIFLLIQGLCWLVVDSKPTVPRARLLTLAGFGMSALPFLVLWLPIFFTQAAAGTSSWMGAPSLSDLLFTILDFYGGPLLGAAVLLTLLALGAWVPRSQGRWAWIALPESRWIACMGGMIWILPFVFSQFKPIYIVGRQTVILLPFVALLTAKHLSHSARPAWVTAILALLALGTATGLVKKRLQPESLSDRTVAQVLMGQIQTGDAVIFTSLSRPALDYYFLRNQFSTPRREVSFPAELDRHPGWQDLASMRANEHLLKQEAQALTASLCKELPPKARIHLVFGKEPEVGAWIRDALSACFALEKETPIPAPFSDVLLSFENVRVSQ